MANDIVGSRRFLFLLPLIAGWGCADPGSDSNAILSTKVQEAWIFYHTNEGYDNALYEGAATIDDNNCLLIGDAVVVWFEDDVPEVSRIVKDVRAGLSPIVRVGGGQGATIRDEIRGKCPIADVWYGAPLRALPER